MNSDDAEIDSRQTTTTSSVESELQFIAEQWRRYSDGEITLEEYSTLMALNFPDVSPVRVTH